MAREPAPVSRRLLLTAPGEKLLVPANFNCENILDVVEFHPFVTTGAIKKKLDADMIEWATPNVAYALLSNGEMFWLDIPDETRFHGGCAVVKTNLFAEGVSHPCGYSDDEEARAHERHMKKLKCEVNPGVRDTLVLKRFDTYGSVWCRRRYTLENDDTFSFIQWMDSKALKLKEKPIAARLLDVAGHVKSLDESYRVMQKDLSEMKMLLKNCTTLSDASLALAESLKEIVKEQSAVHAALSEQVAKLRSELRRES